MDVGRELVWWNTQWNLAGRSVACKECKALQHVLDGDSVFTHKPGCTGFVDRHYPFGTLRDILSAVIVR